MTNLSFYFTDTITTNDGRVQFDIQIDDINFQGHVFDTHSFRVDAVDLNRADEIKRTLLQRASDYAEGKIREYRQSDIPELSII